MIPSKRSILAASIAALLTPLGASAVDYNFSNLNNGAVGWNAGGNWTTLPVDDGAFPNAIGDFANANVNFAQITTISLNQGITVGRLDVGDSSGTGGFALTIATGTGTNTITFDSSAGNAALNYGNGTGLVTISTGLVLNDSLDITRSTSRDLTLSGAINLNGNTLSMLGTGGGTPGLLTFSGLVSGAGSLVMNTSSVNGNGNSSNFTQANTFSGGTNLTAGTIIVTISSTGVGGSTTNGALGTGLVSINGGAIRATSSGSRILGNNVSAAANFSLGESGVTTGLTLAGTATLTGDRTISVFGGGALGTLTDRQTISGVIAESAPSALTKTGTGTLVLTGANTYTGATSVLDSSLVLGGNAPSGAAGTLGNATSAVSLGGVGSAVGNNIFLAIGVPGASPGAATITVARDITVGNVNSSGTTTLGSTTDTDAVFSGTVSLSRSVLLQSNSTATRSTTFSGMMGGGAFNITKTGTGILRLSNANTFTGTTTVRNGTLLAAGNVAVSTDSAFGNSATAIVLSETGQTVATDNLALGIDGAFTIARPITVNAVNSSGTTTLTGTNATSTTATYSGAVTLNRAATFLANATAGATTRFTGVIDDGAGSNGVTINGPGIVEFNGAVANSYNGLTTASSGTLRLNGATDAIIGDANTGTTDLLINGGTVLYAASHQIADNATIQMTSGTLDVGGFTETIYDLLYTNGAILNAGNLTITNSADLFVFDGQTINGSPTVLNQRVIYAGSTTQGNITGQLALDSDPVHEFAINDGAAAIDLDVSAQVINETTASTITKTGAGVLRLSAAGGNTFGGAGKTITLTAGTLAVGQDNQLGDAANTVTFNGGFLRFETAFATSRVLNLTANGGGIDVPTGVTETLSTAGQIAGPSNLVKIGTGTLVLSGDNSASWTSGAALLSAGTLSISAENNLGAGTNDVTFQGGTLEVTSGFTTNAGKVFTLGTGGGTLNVGSAQTLTLAGTAALVGNTTLLKTGAGTFAISGANATLAAGAGVNVIVGALELQNAQSLGNATKALVTLGGGGLTLRNDTATTFGNPVTVAADGSITSDVQTGAAPAVTHTVGAVSLGAFTLSVATGTNVGSGLGGVSTGAITLTGNGTLSTPATAALTAASVALGTSNLTVTGSGTTTISGAISGGPGAGNTALTKNGIGLLVLSSTAPTLSGNTIINGGILRMNSLTALGSNGTNTITVNSGGTLGMGTSAYASNPLVLAGGTVAGTGQTAATWNGLTGATPSITFTADTVFNLWDAITPATDADVNFSATNAGVVTSTAAVNITVNANATNANAAPKKLRFNNTTTSGSVTGTLTINPAAIAQIRSGGGTQNALGSGVLLKLNTGINLTTPGNSGRLEVVSELDANFGNDVQLLGDSTINVQRISAGSAKIMTLNDLEIGTHTLSVVDASGAASYSLVFDGTTTLVGNATFLTLRPLTLATITDGAGTFGLTKGILGNANGTATLTINGGGYDGATTVNLGTLSLGASNIMGDSATVTVNAGTLALGANSDTVGAFTVTGSGVFTSTAGGTLTTSGLTFSSSGASIVNAILAGTGGLTKTGAGLLTLAAANTYAGDTLLSASTTLSANNAIPLASNVSISAGTLAVGTTMQSFGTLTFTGTGTTSSTAGSQITTTGINFNGTATPTINAILAGTGGLTKISTGTVTLAATNTYAGLTSISAGALTLGAAGALPGNLSITNGATVNQSIANGFFSAASDVTVDASKLDFGGFSATLGDLTITGVATATANVVTNNSGATLAVITMDKLTVNSSTSSSAPSVTVNSGGSGAKIVANQVEILGGFSGGAILIGGGAAGTGVEVGSGGLQISNIATGSYNAVTINFGTNGGRLLLGGDLTFIGNANISSVGLVVGTSGGVRGAIDLGGGNRTFDIGDGAADVDLFTNLNITNGALIKTGAGTFSISGPANSYTGDTTINGGVLKKGAANVIPDGVGNGNVSLGALGTFDMGGFAETINGLSGSGTVDNTGAGAATLTVGNNDATSVHTGTIQDTGGALTVDKIGTGTLTLSGPQNYSTLITTAGTTNVNGSFTGGTATVNANATTNFGASQTLLALNIGTVTLAGFVGGSGSAVVPEPGSIGLLMVGALGVLSRRRRK